MTPSPSTGSASADARRRLLAKRLRGGGTASAPVESVREVDLARVPLSPAQHRVWLHEQLHPGGTAYVIRDAVALHGRIDPELLREAAARLSARHEALRTTFHAVDGVPHATVHPRLDPELTVHQGGAEDVPVRVLDLERGPLLALDLAVQEDDRHVLVFSLHHVVGDGWSMSVLVRELTALYLALSGRPAPDLPALPVQYPDVVLRQRRFRDTPAYRSQVDYWRTRLSSVAPVVGADGLAGATTPVRVDAEVARRLQSVCRAHQITPFMALLAAFTTVLARRTGSAEQVVGTPVAGRLDQDTGHLIGYFSSTVPLVVDTAGDPSAAGLWERAKTATLGGLANQDVGLGEIGEAAGAAAGQSLFQALFALQNYPFDPIELDELTVVPLALAKDEAKLDLSLYLYERDGGFEGYLEHRLAAVDADGARRLVADLVRTLDAMVADPAAPLSRLDLVGPDERDLLLTARLGDVRPRPDVRVHDLVEASVRRVPDAVAVLTEDGAALTYDQLDRRANRLAHWLLAGGLRPEEQVGLLLPRGADLVTAVLGVLKAGGAFVPVDPEYPAERVRAMLAGSRTVLTPESITDVWAAEHPDTRPEVEVHPDALAYVVFTSGSTGTPKGIGAQHRGVVNHNLSTVELFGLTGADRVLNFSSPSFDATIEEVLPALAVGAAVVPRPADLTSSFQRFDEFVAATGLTVLGLPTAFWERWHDQLRETGAALPDAVRMVTLSGQRVNAESTRAWEAGAETARVELVNTYGPTEATVTTSTYAVAGGTGTSPAVGEIPIGAPWPNYRAYVLDPWLRLVPDGAVGELFVGGAGVSRGYLGQPALTAASYLPDPFGVEPGARMYRTGDQVRWRSDGTLEFVGRFDDQVKIRGNRVELGEVEGVLATHPAVRACAVLAYDDGRGDRFLGAHVVLAHDVEPAELARHLAARLPEYMVPAGFTRHDAFPVTPNGKVDRRALTAPAVASDAEFRPPATDGERALAAIWRDVLVVERVGRDDDFFTLGGTSLVATVLSSRIHRDLGRALPLAELFGHPTLAGMAGAVERAGHAELAPITAAPVAEHHLASPAQRRIFLLQEASGSGTSYNMPVALEIDGVLDPVRVEAALDVLLTRHEALRTTFEVLDGEVRQRVRAHPPLRMPVLDVTEAALDATLTGLVRPFDLAADPLLRATWLRRGPERAVLFLDIHHAAADGASLDVLVDEFLAVLGGADLAPVALHYKDFSHWQHTRADTGEVDRAYWRDRVRDVPELAFPLDRARPERQTFEGVTTEFTIPATTAAALGDLAAREGATVNIALLSAYAALLTRYAAQAEVVIGSLVAGRHHPDLAGMVGMFANFLPLRLDVRADDTFRSLLARHRDGVIADYDHQELPFDDVVALAERPPGRGRNPLFDTMLVFQGGRAVTGDRAGPAFRSREVVHGTAKLDLKLDVFPQDGGALLVRAEANSALLDVDSVVELGERFTRLCQEAVSTPDSALDGLAWLSAAEDAALAAKRHRTLHGDVDLVVAAGFTAEPIADHLRWWCGEFGLDARIRFAGFGQVFQQLLDPESDLRAGTGPALVLVRFEDWADPEGTYPDLLDAVRTAADARPLLVAVLPPTPEHADLTERWRHDLAGLPGVEVVDLVAPVARFGVREVFDPTAYDLGRVPFTDGFFAAAATEVARHLVHRFRPPFKVIAVDADGTLWRGVAAEDGPLGVVVDDSAAALQRLLLRKRSEGMLLVLVSKNAEQDVWEVFDRNDGMLLDRSDLTAWRIDWNPKSANLRALADELGLGLDSVVFLDDSGAECAEVRAAEPDVLTVRLPADPAEHPRFLEHLWALDRFGVTADDTARADRYQAERLRREGERAAPSVESFLAGMELRASYRLPTAAELDRVAQLTQRTNQFNLSGLRLRREDLAEPGLLCHVVEVRDRFGDHGLVGAVLAVVDGDALHVRNIVLSCRVLGRTVEEALLAGLRRVAAEHGAVRVTADFTRTDRNEPARAFLADHGWTPSTTDGVWEAADLPEEPRYVRLEFGRALESAAPPLPADRYRLDHIGVAVRDLTATATRFAAWGFTASPVVRDPSQRSELVMLAKPGWHRVELVAPLGADSPTTSLLDRRGEHPYHLCFQVESLPRALADWTRAGVAYVPVSDERPAVLFGGRRVRFLHVDAVGLVELVETVGAGGPDLAPPAAPASEGGLSVLVTDPAKAADFFAVLGYRGSPTALHRAGSATVTLVGPEDGVLADLLADNGPGPLAIDLGFDAAEDYLRRAPVVDAGRPSWPVEIGAAPGTRHDAHLVPLRHPTVADLLALPVAKASAAARRAPHLAARDDLEEVIVDVFADVLGVADVGVHDSAFALGGHSLQAVSLLSRVQRATGVTLTLPQIFDHPTPAGLADLVRAAAVEPETAPLPRTDDSPLQPASSVQGRFMVHHRLDESGTQLNLPHAVRIEGAVDVDRVRGVFHALLARHEVLRTGFTVEAGELLQVVHPVSAVDAELVVGTASGPVEDEVARFVRPFDLTRPPLIRMTLLRRPDDHLLLVDVHHIIADGVSLGLLVREFLALYRGDALPEVRQYRDWVAHERALHGSARFRAAERYWLTRFGDEVPVLDLPTDHPRPAVQDADADNVRFRADRDLVSALREVGDAAGATLYMTVLAALYVVLWRHTRQTDLVIGSPVAGRIHPDVQDIPGPFLNILPLRADVDPEQEFTGLLARVRETVVDGMEHQLFPFEQLVERLEPTRDTSRNPLFDVMLAFQNLDLGGTVDGDLTAHPVDVDTGRGQFDLELFAHPVDGGLEFKLDFATALFRRATVERIADRLLRVLRAVAADPSTPVHRIDLLDAAERAELTAGVNTRSLDLPSDATVLSLIEGYRDSGRAALVCGPDRLDYADLDAGAERVAGLLRARGVRREEVVGVLLDRGTTMAEAILGAWKAGAAYVPVDAAYPVDRIRAILGDAGCRTVLTTERHLALGDGCDAEFVALDQVDSWPVVSGDPVSQDDLAYALFTSGSTGRPKGALVEQRGMLNHVLAKALDVGMDSTTVLAQTASHCFDISVWQFFGALVVGGTTVVYPEDVANDPRELVAAVRRDGVTLLEIVPSMLEVVLDLVERGGESLDGLTMLLVTGEAVRKPLLERWFRLQPDIPVMNAYGPTEASDDITHHVMTAAPTGASVPIGRPIPNARLYVLDDTGPLDRTALAPFGVKGEICVAGPCVGRGYVGDPAQTDRAFVPDPFEGGRLYRTGDIGRWLPDGTLEFFGRKDHQVKIRGHRIELGEIESVLAGCPGVAASVVVVHADTLVGYVVADQDHPADGLPELVRAHLASRLPGYAVPPELLVLDGLPLTPNGKVDRKSLPVPGTLEPEAVEPLDGDLEIAVAELFGEVLGVEVTSATADFFALGGHSLKAVMLLAGAHERFGVNLPLAAAIQRPTVREVAATVDRALRLGEAAGEEPMTRLSPDHDDKLFLFPPIAGWGLVYLPFAEALPGTAVHAFDFVETPDRVTRYADLVAQAQPDGPLRLGGYSAGGNLAFEVARELEARGRTVADLVLYDVLVHDESSHESADRIRDRVVADIAEGLRLLDPQLRAALASEGIQERAATKRAAYVEYWNDLVRTGTIAADVLLVRAADGDHGDDWPSTWQRATSGVVTVVEGSGRHVEMMAGDHAAANAALARRGL